MKTIITAALTGALTTRKQCPDIPYTAAEIAREARRAGDAGAAIVHIHARGDDGRPVFDVESYAKIDREVRALCPELIVNYSTGAVGIGREERIAHIPVLKPEMAALNMGSMNYAIYSSEKKRFYHDHVFANPFADIQFYLEAMNAAGTMPELECFDAGHIHNTAPLVDLGLLKPPLQISLVMGVLGGIPATTRNLVFQVESLPEKARWQVIGIGPKQWPLLAAAVTMGGHVRVGLEDNLYLSEGVMARGNGELVEKAVRIITDLGGTPASAAEARALLGMN